ncbi:MAG TPA: alpha-N-acetylglucosaminidase C-terminal domain-containing protein, partial [Arachidicoccus sp.]|nr:alpha-N-acetylglucosaminidase C-terminal domain-containing protein [Arachidicoccus sp.]
LLNAVPENHLLLLDLWADENPIWSRTQAFYGKNYIWCMLHNFGGRQGLYGNMEEIASGPATTRMNKASGHMQGIGVVPEGIEQNPVIYELMLANVWTDQPIDLNNWLRQYVYARYGQQNEAAQQAWDTLRASAYQLQDNSNDAQSIITGRPTMDASTDWTFTDINYNPASMVRAWTLMLKASSELSGKDPYQYDLVDLTRQVLANYANIVQRQFAQDYARRDSAAYKQHYGEFTGIIDDLDRLMATRKEFMLGTRIHQARSWGTNQKEKDQYEMNARDLITLWADKDCVLHEYAYKQWSGLLQGFYKARWEQFNTDVLKSLASGQKLDVEAFDEKIKDWEWKWVNATAPYPTEPKGDAVAIAKALFEKYHQKLAFVYAK